MILRLNARERNFVVLALTALAEDYQVASESLISGRLRREFAQDATEINSLAGYTAGLVELLDKPSLDAQARLLLAGGQKIEAIKLVRANSTLGLKEAKDYVEAL